MVNSYLCSRDSRIHQSICITFISDVLVHKPQLLEMISVKANPPFTIIMHYKIIMQAEEVREKGILYIQYTLASPPPRKLSNGYS